MKDYFKPERIEKMKEELKAFDHDCHVSENDGCNICDFLEIADDKEIIDKYYQVIKNK